VPFTGNKNKSAFTDKELVDLYKKSTGLDALGELYRRYMDLVYGVCLRYLKDSEAAKDAVMQLFEELVIKLKKHEVENFKPWLYQVAKNYCLMQLRLSKKLKTVEINPSLMQNEQNVHLNGVLEKEENLQKMEHCMKTLTDEQRTVIQLFYLEGKCYNEIVESTGHEWSRVRSFIQNGRRNLKLCMEKMENGTRKYEV
jgi:RNA polymerase sigma factor (sigma-70 family)